MLRFIFKNTYHDISEYTSNFTVDVDVPEIQKVLENKSFSGSGCEFNTLIGIEVINQSKQEK